MAHSHDSRAEDGSSTLCGTGYGKGSVDKALATGRLPDRKIATGRLPRTLTSNAPSSRDCTCAWHMALKLVLVEDCHGKVATNF